LVNWSIDRLKSYFYYLLLVVAIGVPSAGGGQGSSAMVACLQATATIVLTSLETAALDVLVGSEGGEGVLVFARLTNIVALVRSSSYRRFAAPLAAAMLPW
jgi:hypothetical protein